MEALNKFGDVAGKIAGDFTGKQVTQSTHPHQVILALLSTNAGSQVLARRLYRTFARPETSTVHSDDLRNAFENDEEADAAFSMFDKDMNGDISMEELEAVCAEIGRERKSITASLKDLDSVVSKLDGVFLFIVAVITILVFISLISTSAAGVLTSAGSTVLALSWLFSATAQELLQSLIFVFVKHPFDVGDRVAIYGNTGSQLKGDDYFVKEISLLYTEFKKLEGHVVQAPNSYLNTLFILNQRRSGGLAEAVPIVIKFGTSIEQIDSLRQKLLDFVTSEKREYQGKILTELREVTEAHSLTVNIVFFYKSNWQNELLRLQRRNKFISALMVGMQELGIEGPRMRYPGQKESFPLYMQNIPHIPVAGMGHGGTPDDPAGYATGGPVDGASYTEGPNDTATAGRNTSQDRGGSILRTESFATHQRKRTESLAQMSRRMDFSLGMRYISAASGDMAGDVFQDRDRTPLPISITSPSPSGRSASQEGSRRRASGMHADYVAGGVGRSSSILRPGSDQIGSRLERIATDSSQARQRPTHRNRFFGVGGSRRRTATNGSDATDPDEMMEMGMADIPEGISRVPSLRRLDPRSGTISPAAWRASSDDDRRNMSFVNGAGASVSPMTTRREHAGGDDAGVQIPRRARTDL